MRPPRKKAYLYEPPRLPNEEVASPRKVYRTVDLVRQNPDGSYNFIGRRDDQVKIRGQRVELKEIETVIRQASLLVSRVKAIYRRDWCQQAKSTLAAFIKFKPQFEGVDKELDAIKAYLVSHLSSYMIPDHYIILDYIPLTLNGKTDIASLQQILDKHQDDISENQKSSAMVAENSLNKEEAILRTLWASILGIEKGTIGQSSNFIELGGSSLDAMQLVSAARAEHLALSFRSIMESPRLEDMGAACKTHVSATSILQADTILGEYDLVAEAAQLMSLPYEAIETCYPCSTTQETMFLSSIATAEVYILQNVYRVPQKVDKRRFQEACEMVVRQYPILRT
ncbi:acetyl-CoA synthetase-like protein [Penicillium malachiteum]|uniref:Acetyl-CoA synthetase-like protein n=1 Tax=Penicillium malachiteum TaxID=1324776 RepID=A0AAD6HTT1_9EURO|nr:acetyl-CoA synthetase-like protein [Penicillium malachiteum]